MGCTYWARIFARKMSQAAESPDDFAAQIAENLKLASKVRETGADYFYRSRSVAAPVERHLPVSRDDAGLGLEMVAVSLGRLHSPRVRPAGQERGL
jgi:uncharacterized membrane protein YccC